MTETVSSSEAAGGDSLRLLVACSDCALQYDASELAAGHRFHCACGSLVTVPEPRPQVADVVRCSACGGPRDAGRERCGYCGGGFTLHERDLHTLCPGCMVRISDRARYCHACATPIAPQARAGEPTARLCPACGERSRLHARRLEGEEVAVLECGRCAGLWLGADLFRLLEERARSRQAEWSPRAAGESRPADPPVYRPCAACGRLMHRRNYGRRSGVIVDVCSEHGLWFDSGELERILEWIRSGGLLRSEELAAAVRHERQRHRRSPVMETSELDVAGGGGGWARFVGALLDAF